MNTTLNNYLRKIWLESGRDLNRILSELITPINSAKVLDIGPYDGKNTLFRFKKLKKPKIFAVDIDPRKVLEVRRLNITAKLANAEKRLPFNNNTFDVVTANQIIEHLVDVDTFMSETYRVIKPQGYLLLATENLSSWHNIFALLLGWQAFSQHISRIKNIGNPLRLADLENYDIHGMHVKIFTPRGLSELAQLHGFKVRKVFGSGYYPLPSPLSNIFSEIDQTHTGFIGIKAYKNEK